MIEPVPIKNYRPGGLYRYRSVDESDVDPVVRGSVRSILEYAATTLGVRPSVKWCVPTTRKRGSGSVEVFSRPRVIHGAYKWRPDELWLRADQPPIQAAAVAAHEARHSYQRRSTKAHTFLRDNDRSEADADGWATEHVPRWLDRVCTGGCHVLEDSLKRAGKDPEAWFREQSKRRERYLNQLRREGLLVDGVAPEEDEPMEAVSRTLDGLLSLLD